MKKAGSQNILKAQQRHSGNLERIAFAFGCSALIRMQAKLSLITVSHSEWIVAGYCMLSAECRAPSAVLISAQQLPCTSDSGDAVNFNDPPGYAQVNYNFVHKIQQLKNGWSVVAVLAVLAVLGRCWWEWRVIYNSPILFFLVWC